MQAIVIADIKTFHEFADGGSVPITPTEVLALKTYFFKKAIELLY